MIRDSLGQTALIDAIIFMILMSLASGIILGFGGDAAIQQSEMEGIQQYSHDFADTLLSMEVGEHPRPISEILCDQAIIRQSNFTAMNETILEAGNLLVRPGLAYAISYQDNLISSHADFTEELPDERYASQRLYNINGKQVDIIVFVWVIE